MKPKISFIAAIARKDRGMGYQGKIQWHISADWKRFKELTKHHVVIMGRKTLESLPKLLPDRVSIVVTRDISYERDGVIVVHSIEEAIDVAKELIVRHSLANEEYILDYPMNTSFAEAAQVGNKELVTDEIFIIGGGELFTQAIDKADKLYLTLVDGDYPADAYFPDYSAFTKVICDEKEESEGYTYEYIDLER